MYSVVIIDDNKIAVEAIAKSTDWEKCGCRVAGTAYDGIAGLELIHDVAPDIVIIDIQMPGFNGLDVIKKITEMDPAITVNNVGEVDFIIDYHRPKSPNWVWEWIKTIFDWRWGSSVSSIISLKLKLIRIRHRWRWRCAFTKTVSARL